MKTWKEITEATIHKLFLVDDTEADQYGYLNKFAYLANECLSIIANGVKPKVGVFDVKVVLKEDGKEKPEGAFYNTELIPMPEDFLSFGDMINYKDGDPDPEVVYVTDSAIHLPEPGEYSIFYNASYDDITEEYTSNGEKVINIPKSVLMCLPSYIASQVLSQDDVQRSTILKNEFELMLSRLDTNVSYEANHFKSSGGWY